MADVTERVETTTASLSPVDQLVQNSTTSYTRPPETQPSVPTSVTIATTQQETSTASSTAETPYTPPILTTSTGATAQPVKPSYELPKTSEPIASKPQETITSVTKPLIINQLMIDPVIGTSIPLSNGGSGGGGFGGGGGMPEEKTAEAGVQKKSLLPILLMAIGATLILTKVFGKKKEAK